jgi:tetratricopeptide (TPR) repeat protein
MTLSHWRVTVSAVACALASSVLLGSAAGQQRPRLDQIFAAYSGGDHDVVLRSFANSHDYLRHRLSERRRVEQWLGAWSPDKAMFLAELVERASSAAPAYLPNLVTTGHRYVLGRPSPPGASALEDDLERRWHLLALGVMQRRFLGDLLLRYVDVLRTRRPLPAAAAVWDPRIDLARGIAQEQLCRVLHATARHDRLLADLEGVAATPPMERQAAIECMRRALTMLEEAAAHADVRAEAHTRAGFAAFQLGQTTEAKAMLDGARPGPDRALAYWRSLFSGRVADALAADADAEAAYRAALAAYPEAQSAWVGLALALFRMNRSDEADAAMRAARNVSDDSVDPWESYFEGDARFVTEWLVSMRKARR